LKLARVRGGSGAAIGDDEYFLLSFFLSFRAHHELYSRAEILMTMATKAAFCLENYTWASLLLLVAVLPAVIELDFFLLLHSMTD